MEVVSFDDTLEEMERIVALSLNESKIVSVNSIDIYIATEELGRSRSTYELQDHG